MARFIGVVFWICTTVAAANDVEFPRELVAFEPAANNPVFEGAGPGQWDARIRERGWILFEQPSQPDAAPIFRMWYTGYDGTREGIKRLGYATSSDGIRWTRHPDNPLDKDLWIEDMQVVKHGNTYLMFAEGRNDQAQLLKSQDGIHWTRVGALDVRQTNGQPIEPGPYGTPAAWFENNTWYLFYERQDLGVWLAKSPDLGVWQNVEDEPVLWPGPGEHERDLIALNQIVKHGGRYYAYYHGSKRGSGLWSTNIAVSSDLRTWKKYDRNPLFPVEANKSSGILVHQGQQYRLYTMHDKVQLHMPKSTE